MSAARSSAFGGSEALWPLAAGVAASWRARLAWLGAFQGKRGVSSCRKAEGALVGEPRRLQLRDAASTQRGGCREGIGDRKRKTESNGGRKVGGVDNRGKREKANEEQREGGRQRDPRREPGQAGRVGLGTAGAGLWGQMWRSDGTWPVPPRPFHLSPARGGRAGVISLPN